MPPPPRRGKKGPPSKPKPVSSTNSKPAQSSKIANEVPASSKADGDENQTDAFERFPLELRWCLQQLEIAIENKKSNPKEVEDLAKSYKTLAGPKAPLIKKRQVMRMLFGDYRQKMADEEKKFKRVQPRIKTSSELPTKSRFLKKSAVNSQISEDNPDRTENVGEGAVQNSTEDNNQTSEVTPNPTKGVDEEVTQQISTQKTTTNKQRLNFDSDSGKAFRFNFSVPD